MIAFPRFLTQTATFSLLFLTSLPDLLLSSPFAPHISLSLLNFLLFLSHSTLYIFYPLSICFPQWGNERCYLLKELSRFCLRPQASDSCSFWLANPTCLVESFARKPASWHVRDYGYYLMNHTLAPLSQFILKILPCKTEILNHCIIQINGLLEPLSPSPAEVSLN